MNAKFTLENENKVAVTFGDGREISLLLTNENCEGEHIRVTGESSLIIKPCASNQVRIKLA